MNNIRGAAIKAVKNQFNTHLPNVPPACNEWVIEANQKQNKNLNNNCMFIRPRVEFENNKASQSEKPKAKSKHIVAYPSIQNLLCESPTILQHSLNSSECRQNHISQKSLIEQGGKPKKYFIPHRYHQSGESNSSNSVHQPEIIENEKCYIKSEGNKIIINPKINPPPFFYPKKNNSLPQQYEKRINNRGYQSKHDVSWASTQNTKENINRSNHNENNKEVHQDFGMPQKQTRQKKTVFKTPAFLKNKELINSEQAEKNQREKRANNSMPKNFKALEFASHKTDGGSKFMEDKQAGRNNRIQKQCISHQKPLKNSHSNKEIHFNTFSKTSQHEDRNLKNFKPGWEVCLRIFNSQKHSQHVNLKIVRLLAQNGLTSVYLVIQKSTNFLFCLKKTLIKPSESMKEKNYENKQFPNALDYLIRQSKIGMSLDHPFLIKTYCTLYDDKNIYQLMEFVEGSTLHNLTCQRKNKGTPIQLKSEKSIHPTRAIKQIITELLEGIIYLHEKKIVHRDLKPANIFISNNHAFKIGDFGCSIYSQPNDFVGTLDYVAPEIMLHEPHGSPVDMWAIGCIAFELYTGQPPFYHPKRKQTIQKIVEGSFDLEKIENRQLKDFIFRLLQKDPTKRLSAKEAYEHSFIQQNAQNRIQV